MRRIAIAGAGLAGLTAAQELRRRGFDGELVMLGAERHRPYRRPPLSKDHLLGLGADPALAAVDQLEVDWRLGRAATGLDLTARLVLCGTQPPVPFDGLVIATGARARTLAGTEGRSGVFTLRTLDDADALRVALAARPRVVVAGGGFLGSEIAAAVRTLGLPVTLVHPGPVPLRARLGEHVGAIIAGLHRAHDVELRPDRRVVGVAGHGRLERVRLDDGTVLPADLLVVALGAEPDTDWLRGSGLHLERGVIVDNEGFAAPGVTAAGDAARWPSAMLGGQLVQVHHYSNAVDQGVHAAGALLGTGGRFNPVPSFWCHLYGHRLTAVGFPSADHNPRLVTHEPDGRFFAEYHYNGRPVGAVATGHLGRLAGYRNLVTKEHA